MSISLDQLLGEADALLEKNAAQSRKYIDDDADIFKLAHKLQHDDEEVEKFVETPFEKIARAIAIIETVQTINNLESASKFEKVAKENGYSDEQIDKFLGDKGMLPLHKVLTIPECLLC